MGNCQAIDSAALVIQHPSGKVDKLYSPIGATQIMKMNPGHYVALLLTTTLYSSTAAAANNRNTTATTNNSNTPLRITRIKLLRPTDTLLLGHVYRLVTSQEVMKGLFAKKQAKMSSKPDYEKKMMMMREKVINSDFEAVTEMDKSKKVKQEKQRSRNNNISNNNNKVVKWGVSKSRGWQPSLKSISEAAGS